MTELTTEAERMLIESLPAAWTEVCSDNADLRAELLRVRKQRDGLVEACKLAVHKSEQIIAGQANPLARAEAIRFVCSAALADAEAKS